MDTTQTPTPSLKKEIRTRTIGYILTAFGLVAGLAWNDAIKSLIDRLFPLETDGIWVKFAYAVIITLVVIIISVWLGRAAGDKQ